MEYCKEHEDIINEFLNNIKVYDNWFYDVLPNEIREKIYWINIHDRIKEWGSDFDKRHQIEDHNSLNLHLKLWDFRDHFNLKRNKYFDNVPVTKVLDSNIINYHHKDSRDKLYNIMKELVGVKGLPPNCPSMNRKKMCRWIMTLAR